MNRFLPIAISFLFVFSSYSQNANLNKKSTGFKNGQKITRNYTDVAVQQNTSANPVKIKHSAANNFKIAAVTATRFTGSMNVFGLLFSESKPLQYNKSLNAVSFIHTKSVNYIPSSNGNSRSIVGMYSTNTGTSWDSTCIWANVINMAHYPQGGIFNPLGNTNINNAYIVGCGPISFVGPWDGNWYASKQITTPGTTTPGTDQQALLSSSLPSWMKHHFSRYSFTSNGMYPIRAIGNILSDPNGVTNATFGLRGAAMVKGMFSAGAFVWSVDSFVPCIMSRSDGSKYLNEKMIQAWDDAGVNGYVIMLGIRCGICLASKSYQPIVYKTTNGGVSWTLLPANDFTSAITLLNRLYPINTNSTIITPYFSSSEGIDAVVDINGQLHLACTVVGAYSSHNDSLDYIHSFGIEKYSYKETGPFQYPAIYDFYTQPIGGWNYHLVDSMGTEGPSGLIGQPGYTTNVWTDGAGGKIDQSARIQISRSDNGAKIFYSWTESDTNILINKWNIYPDIKMRGLDVPLNKSTPRFNMSGGITNADQESYYHYMSSKAISTGTTSYEIPLTITQNSTTNGAIDVNHYYLKGASFATSSFSINSSSVGFISGCGTLNVPEKTIEINSFNIIPNPSDGLISVSFLLDKPQDIKLNIFDYLGRLIKSEEVKGLGGSNEINLDLSSYNRGVYLINVVTNSFTATKKIIKE